MRMEMLSWSSPSCAAWRRADRAVSYTHLVQTIVMITHNEEIAQLSDRIVRIEDGRIAVR